MGWIFNVRLTRFIFIFYENTVFSFFLFRLRKYQFIAIPSFLCTYVLCSICVSDILISFMSFSLLLFRRYYTFFFSPLCMCLTIFCGKNSYFLFSIVSLWNISNENVQKRKKKTREIQECNSISRKNLYCLFYISFALF